MGLLGRRGIVVCGVGVAVWHLRRVGVEEVDWWIMALVDMVCVHDMTVACIAHGWKGLEAQRVSWAHEGGNKDRAEEAGRDDGGAGGRGKRKRGRRREGDGRERASTERPHPLSRGRRETESTSRSQPFIFHLFSPIPARPRAPPAFPFRDYPTDAAPAAEDSASPAALSLPPSTLPAATARRPTTQAQAVHSARDSPPVTTIDRVVTRSPVHFPVATSTRPPRQPPGDPGSRHTASADPRCRRPQPRRPLCSSCQRASPRSADDDPQRRTPASQLFPSPIPTPETTHFDRDPLH
ncbi:hypothetical protein K466DRAFT_109234 [Polyporus arcularius HHB13444]|uniref:Uncharacterized protein n=1 Tax=Polyporus arcularius HHB13444 TaxID=1314778 RepID=A0A5C3PV76_9APHY|nr:hypothetical protein K466DRAFT_109234 [Polyporus arcularius HHB13444]